MKMQDDKDAARIAREKRERLSAEKLQATNVQEKALNDINLIAREKIMRKAIAEALKAEKKNEVPIGAVVTLNGKIIARAHNLRNTNGDPTAHAEVLALRKAGKKLGRWNLSDCELYVTLEPCAMCGGAVVYSRIKTVIFGAYDKRFGCLGTVMNLADEPKLNHRAEVIGGVLLEECLKPITEFFRLKRKIKKLQDGAEVKIQD